MRKINLSVVVPAYNEEKTLQMMVERLIATKFPDGVKLDLIIVNDASKDMTLEIATALSNKYPYIMVLSNEINLGKSQTVKKGMLATNGDYVIIQDADLEYDPMDIPKMIELLLKDELDVVYGNRFINKNKVIYWANYYGNKALSAFSNIFTYPRLKIWIPDMEVCYKLVDGNIAREIAKKIESTSNFGFEPEVTAKLSKYIKNKQHLRFGIIDISYSPRTIAEGKKMKAVQDGIKALIEIIKYNV